MIRPDLETEGDRLRVTARQQLFEGDFIGNGDTGWRAATYDVVRKASSRK